MTPPLVKRYLVAFDRHKWAGLAGFAVVMGLSGVAALQPDPPVSYVSEGILAYVEPPLTFSATVATLRQQGQALTEARLLSDEVVEFVAQQLTQDQINLDPSTIRRNTDVEVETEPVLQVTVTYEDTDRQRANQIAELLMEAMAEQSRSFNTLQLNRITENLNELLPQVEQDLRRAEQNLERYIREEGPALQAARDGSLVSAITGSQDQQRQIRLTLAGLDAQIRSLEQRLGLSVDQAYASSALSADPIIADLRANIYQNESQLAILGQRLRPEHPDMLALREQQRAFEDLLRQRVREVIGGNDLAAPLSGTARIRQDSSLDPARQELANQLVTLQTERETQQQLLEALNQSEQQLREEYRQLPNKQLEEARLTQEVNLKKAFYDQIQARLEDVTLAEKETPGNLVIAQPPQASAADEIGRNPFIILVVGGFVGLLVGGGLIILLDTLDATFHTLPDLQSSLRQQEVPTLGLLPLMPVDSNREDIPVVVAVDSPYIEPFERFRSNLRRAAGSTPPKMVLLTSTVTGEGKTVAAYNLAIASARAGKRTLLVEADLRSPSHAGVLNVTPDPDSQVEPLRYYGNINDCIRLVPDVENLYILPSPGPQRQAAALLESSEMKRMLEDVRGRFDMVILDTPSLSRYNDALLLEPQTDGMVLVTRPGFTEEGLLAEAVEQFLESEDIQFLGAVINGGDIPVQSSMTYNEMDGHFIVDDLESRESLDRVTN